MTLDASIRQRILDAVDEDVVVGLLQAAIGIPSVTGDEAALASWLRDQLVRLGADETDTFDFSPGRPDVWGRFKGGRDGPRLLFAAHLDTVHAQGWEQRWQGTSNESPYGGAIIDGEVYGRGAGDVKAGIATMLAAIDAVSKAGLRPAGDVLILAVGDEESGEPDSGFSDGIKAAVQRMRSGDIPTADFAVYVEPTQLDLYTAQLGFIIAEIAITGESAFWSAPWLGSDALRQGHKLIERLWALGRGIHESRDHPLIGRPSLLITEVTAGGQIAVPDACTIKLIRKLVPGEDPAVARSELESVLTAAMVEDGCRATIEYTAGRDNPWGGTPAELAADHPAVDMLERILTDITGRDGLIKGAGYWSELGVLRDELGIAGVYCAPGDIRNCHTLEERVPVDQLADAVRAFALFIGEYCGVIEAEAGP
jgi:acetylornithine deacetylase